MPALTGFNKENCERRNRLTAARGKVETTRIRFVADLKESDDAIVDQWGAIPEDDKEALKLINAKLPSGAEPLTLDDIYIHRLEAASSVLIPDRHAFFSTSTLVNIAKGGAAGVAFMNSHRTGGFSSPSELPFGKTFAGRYQATVDGEGKTTERALLGMYMLRGKRPNGDNGPSTDDLHDAIDGGTVFDVSVGLYPGTSGKVLCDVCGADYRKCDHSAGTTRNMEGDDIDRQRAKGVKTGKATYTIENYELNEVSGVYDGAVPGAGFSKGLSLVDQFSPEERQQFREAFKALMAEEDGDEVDEVAENRHLDPNYAKKLRETISANGGGTGQPGAGKTQAEKPGVQMSNSEDQKVPHGILARVFTRFGLAKIATAIVVAQSDSPDEQANVIAQQVDAEVKDRISNDPLFMACAANGIKTAADLQNVMAAKVLGDKYFADTRDDAKKEAIRAFGAENGPKIASQVDELPFASVSLLRDSWKSQADAKFGTTETKPADRQTKPTGFKPGEGADPDGNDKPKTAWEQLSKEEQSHAIAMGKTTPEAQEAFAKNLIGIRTGSMEVI